MSADDLTAHVLRRLQEIQRRLGVAASADAAARFADVVDSMGLVELVGQLAADCGVSTDDVETCANRRFGTIADLGRALHGAGMRPREAVRPSGGLLSGGVAPPAWLAATAVHLPAAVQPAEEIDRLLGRPQGWLAEHAGIRSRRLWQGEDPLAAAAAVARRCLEEAGVEQGGVTALLVTGEAPPLSVGLAAAVHHRLGLSADVPALDVGGACTGLLAALWLGRRLLSAGGAVLVVAVEAASRWLEPRPGAEGEAAALFGDAAAACLLTAGPAGRSPLPIREVALGTHGEAADLLRVEQGERGRPAVRMAGPALAGRSVELLADGVRQVVARHGLGVADLRGVFVHAGNGRMGPLVARRLGLDEARVHSATALTGNLGSASVPAAWAAASCDGPAVWAAVGAGLTRAAALFGGRPQ